MTVAELLRRDPAAVAGELVEAQSSDPAWLDAFSEALDRRRAGHQLETVLAVWGLSQSEAARRLGVSRQAVSKWLAGGVPADRVEALADLSAATDLLVRSLRRDRIPAVVRRPAPALGGESLLDLVGRGETRAVLDACRTMFDFAAGATA